MKVLSFGRRLKQKFIEKLEKFRPKPGLFMSLKNLTGRYLERLARESVLIFSFIFLTIIFINLIIPKSFFEKTKENILINPGNKNSHFILGQLFFSANDLDNAKKETGQSYEETRNQPDKIRSQIIYWQKLSVEIPGYRDAYIKLSILSQKIYRDFDAKKFLEKALEVDPNFSLPSQGPRE